MSTSSSISISPTSSIEITEHGAKITGTLSQKEWINAITTLRNVNRNYLKALGDVVGYGINHFGENIVGKHIEQLEFNLSDANTALGIAKLSYDFKAAYPLTPDHYYLLSKLSSAHLKEKWANACIEHGLAALELKRSIQAGKILTTKSISKHSGLGSGITTIEGALFQFNQWKQQVGEDEIMHLPKNNRLDLLEKLRPVLELAEKLAATLDDNT